MHCEDCGGTFVHESPDVSICKPCFQKSYEEFRRTGFEEPRPRIPLDDPEALERWLTS